MQRIAHGATQPDSDFLSSLIARLGALKVLFAGEGKTTFPFGYLFPSLRNDPDAFLPESPSTLTSLTELGRTMLDPASPILHNSAIPSAYTYFGQFIDHDVAFTKVEELIRDLSNLYYFSEPSLAPWTDDYVSLNVRNLREDLLDLECVYTSDPSPPRYGSLMVLGKVTESGDRPYRVDDDQDVPRQGKSVDKLLDRTALIADPRNDQTLILSQLHVAFLRAHNEIVRLKHSYRDARTILRQHYHWIIIDDFLKRIADPAVVDSVLASPTPLYNPGVGNQVLPLEFSAAAFRFGHSMIRSGYYYNMNYLSGGLPLSMLLTPYALDNPTVMLPGEPCGTLPENKMIEWKNFLDGGRNYAKRIDTLLVNPLSTLQQPTEPDPPERNIAVMDLKRSYLLRIPTGQAVAAYLNLPVMTPKEIEDVALLLGNKPQHDALVRSGLSIRTPLWFYILAEAVHHDPEASKHHLGPVGSRLIAEVLIGLVRSSSTSILPLGTWSPTLGTTPGVFKLADLLEFAKVM